MKLTKLFVGAFALSAMLVAYAKDTSSSITTATPCNVDGENNCVYVTLTDTRDGKTYKTVTIGDQTWMAENLNYETGNSYCYGDDASYCSKYGRLYTWAAAMDSVGTWSTNGKGCGFGSTCSPTGTIRGICPEGWHLPSYDEWNTLFTAVGGQSTVGKVLKSQTGWDEYKGESGNGTDAFGFSALPADVRDNGGYYNYEGHGTHFWSSTENGSLDAYRMCLYYSGDGASLYDLNKYYGFSVRCLKD